MATKAGGFSFDVFLSHNSRDKPRVRELARALEGRGLHPWLDEDDLPPGRPWQELLEQGIEESSAAIVMFGESGLGPWEEPEMRAALDLAVRDKRPVIPVLLPGAPQQPKLPLFLQAYTWVDLRGGITDDGLDRLQWGITGVKPKPGASTPPPARIPPHNLPFPPLGDLFKGRAETLTQLANESSQPSVIAQPKAIHGLGGIGKTRLGVEYAWQQAHRYSALLFVTADSSEGLRSGLAKLAAIDVLALPERSVPQEDEVVGAVLRWLRDHTDWLLILDNVDDEGAATAVNELLSRLGTGRVLITSRLSNWGHHVKCHPLDTLTFGAARDFLLERTAERRAPAGDDSEQAYKLAELLGGLPLALEQAAAYIRRQQLSFAVYLAEWEEERERVLEWYGREMTYPVSLAVTWQRSFDRLGPAAATLLRISSHLAPDPIPDALFEAATEVLAQAQAGWCEETGEAPSELRWRDALAELADTSLLIRRPGSSTVHRMVQEVVRQRIPMERQRSWLEWALKAMNNATSEDPYDVRNWPIWDPLRPHVQQIVDQTDKTSIPELTGGLMNSLGLLLLAKALYLEAEPLMRQALEIAETSYGSQHFNVACCLHNLAQLLKATNRLAEAEPLMRRALEIDERAFGNQHPNVARGLNNLAQLLQVTNRLAEAEPLMWRALEIDEKSFGNQHPNVARDLNNLALLLKTTNRLAEAEPLMRRALEIDEKVFDNQHPNVARDLNNLARLLQDTNRLAEAEPLVRRALEIDKKAFGSQHPNVARDLNNLARLLKTTNRLDEAEPLMRRALEIDEKSFGNEHPKVARDLNNLAQLLQTTNRLIEAEPLIRRALEIDEKAFGKEHPTVARDLNNLAQLLQTTNRLVEAEPLMWRALEIDKKSFGNEHPDVAIDLNNLARLFQATNRHDEAEPLVRRALEIDEKSFGAEHPNVAIRLNNLATLLQDTNRLAEAEPLMRRALEIDEKSFGNEHPDVAVDLNNLARLLQATNRLDEAEPLVRRALAIDEKSLGNEHPDVAIDLNNLALLLRARNQLSEAEPLMRRALEIDQKSFGNEHPDVAIDLNNLALVLKATNRINEAEPLMRRALEIVTISLGESHPRTEFFQNNLASLLAAKSAHPLSIS